MLNPQNEQADRFVSANKQRIDELRKDLLEAVRAYVDAIVVNALPADAIARILDDLASPEPWRNPRTLRLEAVALTAEMRHSDPYWMVIDALSFVSDATGTNWLYMTEERRNQCLTFAGEEALRLQEWLRQNAPNRV